MSHTSPSPPGAPERILHRIPTDHPLASQPATASLRERMAYYSIPGLSLAVIADGAIAWSQGFGVTEAGQDTPVTPATIFQACSISKPVAMAAALRLVAAGALELDRPIQADLTSWQVPANGRWRPQITLRQLLDHTAGLTTNWYRGYRRAGPQPTLLEVLRGAPPATTPPVQAIMLPGSQHVYSGSHYSVLQQLLIDVTGQPFPDLARDLVLAPLGMARSSFDQAYPETQAGQVASGHHIGADPLLGKWRILPEMAAAGLWTTPTDLARLALMIQQVAQGASDFLPRALVEDALTAPTAAPYGLGLELAGSGAARRFFHGGTNIGYTCEMLTYVEHGLGAVVMTNSNDGSSLIPAIMQALAEEYAWPAYPAHRQAPASASPAAPPPEWAGSYEVRPGFILTITLQDDQLWLLAPGQAPLELYPAGPQTYAAEALNTTVRFSQDGDEIRLVLGQAGQTQQAGRIAPAAAADS